MDVSRDLHDPEAIARAGPELLSLALIDARNALLRALAPFEAAAAPDEALHLAGHVGWRQEHEIGRNLQRRRGAAADAAHARLASIEPHADRWWGDGGAGSGLAPDLPGFEGTRAYLMQTLETTLELLGQEPADDAAALHFYRDALAFEDAACEALAALADALGCPGPWAPMPVRAARAPVAFVGRRDGPDFEIDAQAVDWAAYAEFVLDGGYDEARWWRPEGWAWLQRDGRRGPRSVVQLRGGVLLRRFGATHRVPPGQAALHLAWHEADAWCRWAGRRLPTAEEWTLAARAASARGIAWGDVREWTAGGAQCGASWLTPARVRYALCRLDAAPDDDRGFVGFRSCAI